MIERTPSDFDVIVTDFAIPLLFGVDCHNRASALGLAGGDHHGYADTEDIADRPADVPLLGKPFRDKDLLDSIFLAIANAEPQG